MRRPRQRNLFADQLPSFSRPGPSKDRIGVVDVGSNSVRMVVFEGGRRCPAVVFNEKVMCGLGSELAETGRLSKNGVERALRALRRFVAVAPGLQVGALSGVATSAVRDATDGTAFCRRVTRETNIRLEVASGADEARLAAQGVLFGDPRADGLVIDVGGASMEICPIRAGTRGDGVSTPLGPLRFARSSAAETAKIVGEVLRPLAGRFQRGADRLYLVGGAWRALGRVHIARSDYPLPVLHEFAFSADDARQLTEFVQGAPRDALSAIQGVSSSRVSALPHAALLLEALLDAFEPSEIVISGFGLREGVCYESLPAAIRREDPLISTAMGHEQTRARAPGFGGDLWPWLLGAVPAEDEAEARLIRAACHLSDVSWRAHPDYRTRACSEIITRVNLSGAGHRGRAFIGAMLVARYKGGRRALSEEPWVSLLDKPAQARAAAFGALMRLGATLAGATPGFLPHCPLVQDGGTLRLVPEPSAEIILGEEVEKRLGQAARAFDLDWEIAA